MHPDVAALLGGSPQGGPPPGPPPSIQVNPDAHPDAQDSQQKLADAIAQIKEDVDSAKTASDATPVEVLKLEKITSLLQEIMADHHKQEQAALGGGPATAFLKRASGTQ